jgi:hypothetical protein
VLKHTKMMQKHVFLMMASSVLSDLYVIILLKSVSNKLVQHQPELHAWYSGCNYIKKTIAGQISFQTSYGTSRPPWLGSRREVKLAAARSALLGGRRTASLVSLAVLCLSR